MSSSSMEVLVVFTAILLFNNFDGYDYDLYDSIIKFLNK